MLQAGFSYHTQQTYTAAGIQHDTHSTCCPAAARGFTADNLKHACADDADSEPMPHSGLHACWLSVHAITMLRSLCTACP